MSEKGTEDKWRAVLSKTSSLVPRTRDATSGIQRYGQIIFRMLNTRLGTASTGGYWSY